MLRCANLQPLYTHHLTLLKDTIQQRQLTYF